MLQSIRELYGKKLGASDGDIGHVKDFYFDDQNWAIRYMVADAGSWLPGRKVLLSPYSLGRLDQAGKVLHVNLTRKQIENSPAIDSHKPVSRQYEEEYYRYYGWPYYWEGSALWGLSGFPILELPPKSDLGKRLPVSGPQLDRADVHLQSAQAVSGYNVRTGDHIIGHVCDFMMEASNWAIDRLVVKIGHRFSGNEVLVATKDVERISYDESTMFVNLTREAIEQSPKKPLTPIDAAG